MQNKNPSRLSRLPGCIRGTNKQMLVETNVGCANWEAWVKYNDSNTDDWPDIIPLSEALIDPPPLADVLIEGILRKGHKMLISGPSKAGKSFFLMELAVALANGEKWIGFQCRKSRVLYINFEIDSASCIHRFMDIRAALQQYHGMDCSHSDDLMIWNLRGHAMPLNEMVPKITAKCKDFNLDVILVDPIYKVLMGDENNASDMGAFCNEFDKIANLLHCSVIYCHHHSKGAQGFKKAMDRASGSGVFARDPDAQLDMLEIEPPDEYMDATTDTAWQIESSLREFPNIIPKRIWFRYPLHEEEVDGELKHQPIADGSKGGRPNKIDDEKIETYFDEYADGGYANLKAIANALGVHENTLRGYKSKKFEHVSRKGLRRVDG
jgi:RecA-family ATPase